MSPPGRATPGTGRAGRGAPSPPRAPSRDGGGSGRRPTAAGGGRAGGSPRAWGGAGRARRGRGPMGVGAGGGRLKIAGFSGAVRVLGAPEAEIARHADPAVVFMNVNTPEELERARGVIAHG